MKHSVPDDEYLEEEYDEEELSDDYVYVDEDYDDRPKMRIEVILGIIAVFCTLVVVVLLVAVPLLSNNKPQISDSDPESSMHSLRLQEESALKINPILEETEPEATTEPTIPPEANPFDQYDFQYNRNNYLTCLKQESYVGVDVSAFQHDIDWAKVKASGIQFALIRLGYRGYGAKGTLVEDEYVQQNLQGATAVGLPIGAYFFSQATTLDEVYEEIEFMLQVLGKYQLQYPIILDWEVPYVADGEPRTKNVDRRTLTDLLRYYCDEISHRGFDPMVYFNWTQASRMLYLNELEDYPFWLALYQDRMTFPYRVEMWQYTSTGRVPGIEGDVDINLYIPDLRRDR